MGKDETVVDESSFFSPYEYSDVTTTEDGPSLWWDSRDVDYANTAKQRHYNSRNVNIANAAKQRHYEPPMVGNVDDDDDDGVLTKDQAAIIRLYNTRCIIHAINVTAFGELRGAFDRYYSDVISNLELCNQLFTDMIGSLYSNFAKVQPPRNYQYAQIAHYIAKITSSCFEKRVVVELSRLVALKDYIAKAENFLNFHSKCLLDCYFLMRYAYNFNLYKSALRQWDRESDETAYLKDCISKYVSSADNISTTIKKWMM